MIPSNLTAVQLADVKIALQKIFSENSLYNHLNRDTPIFNCVWGSQQISLDEDVRMALTNGKHCEAVVAHFLQQCDLEVQDCSTDCAIPEGPDLTSDSVTFIPNICFEKVVTIKGQECADMTTYQEKLNLQMAAGLAAMDQELEKRTIAYLASLANDLTDLSDDLPVGGLDARGTTWQIQKTDFNSELIIDFMNLFDDQEFINPKYVAGKLFRKERQIAEATDSKCCTGTDSLYSGMPMCINTREFDKVVGSPSLFLVDNAKVGYFNRWIHTSPTPVNQLDALNTHHYYIDSPKASYNFNGKITPVRYDVYWQKICVSEDVYDVRIKIKHRGGFMQAPTGCDGAGYTVIHVEQGPCSNC